jgi:hypothetical protein
MEKIDLLIRRASSAPSPPWRLLAFSKANSDVLDVALYVGGAWGSLRFSLRSFQNYWW